MGPSASPAGSGTNARIKPTNGIPGVAIVLPIGVLQQLAYQRARPFGVRRRQAIRSRPAVNVSRAGDSWKMSVPPFASSTSAARPRNFGNA